MTSNGKDRLPKRHNTVAHTQKNNKLLLLQFLSVKAKLAFTATKPKEALKLSHSYSHGGNSLLYCALEDGLVFLSNMIQTPTKSEFIFSIRLLIYAVRQLQGQDGYHLVSSGYSFFRITRISLALYTALCNDSEQFKKPWLSKGGLLITFQLFKVLQTGTSSSLQPLVTVER